MSSFHVHLMRHGTPTTPGLMLGQTDMPSTLAGIAACTRQASGLPFGAVVASDLQRCAQTASAIAAPRNLAFSLDHRWREMDFGAWDAMPASAVDSADLSAFLNDPEANPPPGGECWSALFTRVSAALEEIADDTLVVTHGGAMRAALACLCAFDQRHLWAFDLPYACVVSLRIWPGTPRTAQIIGMRS